MAKLFHINPDDQEFITSLKHLKEGDQFDSLDGMCEVEGLFEVPTHFTFHQKIFDPGMIIHKLGTNVRVFIPAEALDMKHNKNAPFKDRQIADDGTVLPADKGTQYQPK